MRRWTLPAALLFVTGLGCASNDPRERVIEQARPQLEGIENAIVATMHDVETPFDFEGSFEGAVSVGTPGSPDIGGGVGSPSLGGGVGSPSLGGGVGGRTANPGGGEASLPSGVGSVDFSFVDAVCDLFYGICLWVDRCDDMSLGEVCASFPTEQCRQVMTQFFFELGISTVPAQVTSALRCFADRFPSLGCDPTSAESIYPVCIPGYVPDDTSQF